VNRAELAMAEHSAEFEGLGPWSLQTSRRFWEGFTPAALAGEPARPGLRTVFRAECGWRRAESEVTRAGDTAHVVLAGDGDLDAAAAQACRFLALTSTGVAGRRWATGTQWWPMRRRGCPGCDRAVSIPRTRPRRGRCWRSGCASHRRDRRPPSHPVRHDTLSDYALKH